MVAVEIMRRGKMSRFHVLNTERGFLIPKKTFMDPSYVVDDECAFGGEVFVMKTVCLSKTQHVM